MASEKHVDTSAATLTVGVEELAEDVARHHTVHDLQDMSKLERDNQYVRQKDGF
jgi:hypothetical protein